MNGFNQYKAYQAETASPEEVVVLLYDGARRFTDQALVALEEGNFAEVSLNVGKAQRIFTELSNSLNFSAGDIAGNLWKLYDYWSWRLSQGLLKKDAEAFREVSAVLVDMHGAWAEAARQVRAQRGARALG